MKTSTKILALIMAAALLFAALPISVFAADADAVITNIEMYVVLPDKGNSPSNNCMLETKGCRVSGITWFNKTDSALMDETSAFKDGNKYTVSLKLEADDGYVFAYGDGLTATINGYDANVEFSADGSSITVSHTFKCGAENDAGSIFSGILTFLKTIALTLVRLLGAIIGIG